MALSEEDKKRIEEEEQYRKDLRAENNNKKWYQKTGWIIVFLILFFPVGIIMMWGSNWNRVVKFVITGIFLLLVLASFSPAFKGSSSLNKPNSTYSNTKVEEEQKKKEETKRKQEVQELSISFCSERSKPGVRYVNLDDFIAMYEAEGKTVTLKPVVNVKPLAEKCEQVVDICLKTWNAEECRDIAERKIWIGMTSDQLILSWGLPNDRNNSTYSFGVNSQWVYGTLGPYVYLEGKDKDSMKVTSWQD